MNKPSLQIAGIAAKEDLRAVYRNRYIHNLRSYQRRSKSYVKTFSEKLIKHVKINCAEALSLGTFITHINSFDLELNQIKLIQIKLITQMS